MRNGTVYLVGAGPGDPGLLTLKGLEAIKAADCIIYDFLANSRLLEHARPDAETVYVGKKGSSKTITQDEITKLIIKKAKSGKTVVRLKGGDPFIFGRGAEEAEGLVKEKIPFEIVPGVSSAIAAPAYAGIPLTHRDLSSTVTFVTGQENPLKPGSKIDWKGLAPGKGTLVFLMGWKNLSQITKKLLANGWSPSTPAALIRWGTLTKQKSLVGRLDDIAALGEKASIKPPVITVVGDVVKLKKRLDWFETKPLFGKRVLVTRALEQAGEFAKVLESHGAEPISFPTIKTRPMPGWWGLDRAIKRLSEYDWAIFTSVNGVKYFFERIKSLGLDLRELKGVKICAVGSMTARAVESYGLRVDLTPKEFRAEGLVSALGKKGIKGKRFILPRALKAREVIPTEIERLGGKIDVVPTYKTVKPAKEAGSLRDLLLGGEVDCITFTSASTVNNFVSVFKRTELVELLKSSRIACIGPITAEAAKGYGINVDIMPKVYTIAALTEAMAEYYRAEK